MIDHWADFVRQTGAPMSLEYEYLSVLGTEELNWTKPEDRVAIEILFYWKNHKSYTETASFLVSTQPTYKAWAIIAAREFDKR